MRPILTLSVTLFLVASCGTPLVVDQSKVVDAPAGADKAIETARGWWGMRATPRVVWYGGAGLDCGGGQAYTDVTGTCVRGDQEDDLIIVAIWDGAAIHETGLVHELGHRDSDERGEGGDQDHVGHFFRNPGDDVHAQGFNLLNQRGLVGELNRLLAESGM